MASASTATATVPSPNKPKSLFGIKRGKEYKQIKTSLKYDTLVRVSPATNRPIKDGKTVKIDVKIDVYWCEPCKKRLTNPIAVLQHFTSFQHSQAQKVKVKNDLKRKTAVPLTVTPAKVKKSVPPPAKTHTTPNKSNKPKGRGGAWASPRYSTNNQQQRGGFNLSRSNDTYSYPQSYARENRTFNQQPPVGNNYTWQQQQQFGATAAGLYNNDLGGLDEQSMSNIEMLQARLLRNNQAGLLNQASMLRNNQAGMLRNNQGYQGQSRGSFWGN